MKTIIICCLCVVSGVSSAYAACSSPVGDEGHMKFMSDAKVMVFCNGTNWITMVGNRPGTSTLPSGTVSAFDLASCPSGWSDYTAANSRFIVGVDGGVSYALGDTGGATSHIITSSEMPAHTHAVDPPSTATSSDDAHTHTVSDGYFRSTGGGNNWNAGSSSSSFTATRTTNADTGHNHTIDVGSATSNSAGSGTSFNYIPPYAALKYCEKD